MGEIGKQVKWRKQYIFICMPNFGHRLKNYVNFGLISNMLNSRGRGPTKNQGCDLVKSVHRIDS